MSEVLRNALWPERDSRHCRAATDARHGADGSRRRFAHLVPCGDSRGMEHPPWTSRMFRADADVIVVGS
jgi:hypothetical protein